MSNPYEIEQILTKLLVHETVDGLLFWGPKLLLSPMRITMMKYFYVLKERVR